jgi:outer membrane protein OmpA-like peptidoglycan-associated protein
MLQTTRLVHRVATGLAIAAAALSLSACVSSSALDSLAGTVPIGSPFTKALFRNYAYLANSFGAGGTGGTFDAEGALSIFDSGGGTDDLAEVFATKALIAARGVEVEPEPARDDDAAQLRDRLMRALAEGKDRYPSDAARAQADFDCWMLNSTVSSQRGAAQQCRVSFDGSLARFEHDMHRTVIVPPVVTPPVMNYTVYFSFDSWTLTGEQLTTLQLAIATARAGGQSRITIVGHADTSGAARYNEMLSLKRANVVAETLVDMGARREAIQTSGVGEADLAVQTPDGVKEAKNRRAVVTLVP